MPKSHLARIAYIETLEGKSFDQALTELHQGPLLAQNRWRNVPAGYVRACGLVFRKLYDVVKADPLYKTMFHVVHGESLLHEKALMNLFLLLKYSVKEISGDIIEFGSFRCGTAIFLALIAKALGMKGKVYALDTFAGIPHTDEHIDLHTCDEFKNTSFEHLLAITRKMQLDNLVLVKGCFQDTFPQICSTLQPLSLVHVDCVTYSSVKYALNAVIPYFHPQGYLIVDDALHSSCIGALQAVEETVLEYNLNAEQTCPHLVYRIPPTKDF